MNEFDLEKIVTLKDLHTLTKTELEERLTQLIDAKEYCKKERQKWDVEIAKTAFTIRSVESRIEEGIYVSE